MPGTSIIAIAPGRLIIQTVGLRELSKLMTAVTLDEIPKVLAREMKEAGQPIADLAEAYAPNVSGDFAGSISIRGGRSGISLVSTDDGAGVIEFARQGHHGEPLNAAWGGPPRALFKAINEKLPEVEQAVGAAIEKAYQGYVARAFTTPD